MNEDSFAPFPLPRRDPGAGANGLPRSGEAPGPQVLVVDDESLIADSVASILNRNGYRAVACYSGRAALSYFQERSPDILVTDVVLPDLDGLQLARAVRALSPGTRVVLFSGNTARAGLMEPAADDGAAFELLAKPVHPVQLLRALRAVC